MITSDWFALTETIVIIVLLIVYSYRRKNFLTMAWIIPQVFMLIYYGLLIIDPSSALSLQTRVAIFRPANVMNGVCMVLFLLNGSINNAINNLLRRFGK